MLALPLMAPTHSLTQLHWVGLQLPLCGVCVAPSHTVLAEQLVLEVKRLQKELTMTKGKVQTLNDIIGKMPSEGMLVSDCVCVSMGIGVN